MRVAFNHEHGWSRPLDLARARTQQPDHRAHIEVPKLRNGVEHEAAARGLIRDYQVRRLEHGSAHNRADVVSTFDEAGFEAT